MQALNNLIVRLKYVRDYYPVLNIYYERLDTN